MPNIYQPVVFNIRGPHYRLHYFYCIENSVHLKEFQPREEGGYIIIRGHDLCNLCCTLFSCVIVYIAGHIMGTL